MKKQTLLFIFIITILILLVNVLAPSHLTRIEWFTDQENNWANFGQYIWMGQSFTIGTLSENTDYNLRAVKLKLYKNSGVGTVIVSIRTVDQNGFPTGSDLSTGLINGDNLTTTFGVNGGEWYEIEMSPYVLQKSRTYAIILRAPNSQFPSSLTWKGLNSDFGYIGGRAFVSRASGTYWLNGSEVIITDFLFEVLGEPAIDTDSDGIPDSIDNCLNVSNPNQEETDTDKIGDACDNCVYNYNPDQTDLNKDGIGNACEFLVIQKLCQTYDDFSGDTLDLSKWEEYTGFKVNSFTDEHFVNTSEEVYHIQQNSQGDRETNLKPKRQFVAGESFSYEVIYKGGSGNHFSQPLINGNYPPTQIESCLAPGGCGPIGFWNGVPDLEAQTGTYKINFEFFPNEVKMTTVRPDNITIINTFTGNSAPYNLTINTHTGHNGIMHFDYDNTIICSETDLEQRITTIEQKILDLENRSKEHDNKISNLESLTQNIKTAFENFANKINIYLKGLSKGFKQQMICNYMKENNLNQYQDLGLSCLIKNNNCVCEAV